MSTDRVNEQEKGYDYEVSEPEMEDEKQQRQPTQTKTQGRRAPSGRLPTEQESNRHIAPYQPPPQEEDRREKVLKSRIKDRDHSDANDSSLKIKIELDLEAEVNLYARVKGDVTIGLLA